MTGAVLNAGPGAWAFEEHAERLSRALGVPVQERPAELNYLLAWDFPAPPAGKLFVPYEAIVTASDKRLQAALFACAGVATPRTLLLETPEEVEEVLRREVDSGWVLKWPTGCAAGGHRMLAPRARVPVDWPRPYLLQEFIRTEPPEVFRLYACGTQTFGWNVRRFPPGVTPSPWVAHSRGAHYEAAGVPPADAEEQARRALRAAGLFESFGCVDLLRDPDGRWLVLELGTDGVFNYVDRDLDIPGAAEEIDIRIARTFAARLRESGRELD